jgi:molybdate/tungstate transport system substrate-binding protein
MEGPIAARLPAATGVQFAGEGKGSKALANLIRDGLRNPDVFISADSTIVDDLARAGLVASSRTFGGASMVIGYSPKSPYRALLEDVAAGKRSLLAVLETPGLKLARTDPKLDPKGERSVRAMRLLTNPATVTRILGPDDNAAQIFPEEDLLVRLESGEADAAFLYSTEAKARHVPFVPLPGNASLSREITYTIAVMKRAPHPAAAKTFVDFILTGDGKAILQEAGVQYF